MIHGIFLFPALLRPLGGSEKNLAQKLGSTHIYGQPSSVASLLGCPYLLPRLTSLPRNENMSMGILAGAPAMWNTFRLKEAIGQKPWCLLPLVCQLRISWWLQTGVTQPPAHFSRAKPDHDPTENAQATSSWQQLGCSLKTQQAVLLPGMLGLPCLLTRMLTLSSGTTGGIYHCTGALWCAHHLPGQRPHSAWSHQWSAVHVYSQGENTERVVKTPFTHPTTCQDGEEGGRDAALHREL